MMFDKALSASDPGPQRLRALRALLATGLVLCLALFVHAAQAQDDPPGRVARLSEVNGQVWLLSADSDEWVSAVRNQPVTTGDRLATEAGARAELQVGSTTLRVDASSELEVNRLDDDHLSLMLHSGSAAARLRDAADAGEFDLSTDAGRFRALRAGRYRFDRNGNSSHLTVYEGQAVYEGQSSALTVNPGQHAEFWIDANNVAQYAMSGPYNDPFAAWINERDRVVAAQPPAYQYVSPEMTGADDLDRYGTWEQTPEYGAVWAPSVVAVDWAPYRAGHWAWVRPWGWTWVDDAPWGFAPFHYGRWVRYRERWCWTPGQRVVRPVYAPALVAWVGGPNVSVSVRVGGGPGPAVGWFPLAPREVYVPSYRVSPRYVQNINITHVRNVTVINNVYRNPNAQRDFANRGQPNALTVVPSSVMTGRQPVAPAASRWRDQPWAREIANKPPPTVVAPPVAAPAFVARPADRSAIRPPPGIPQVGQSGGRPGTPGMQGRDRDDRRDGRDDRRDRGDRPGNIAAPATPAPAAVAPPAAVVPGRQPDRRPDAADAARPGFQAPNAGRDREGDGRRSGNDRERPGRPAIPTPSVAQQPAMPAPAPAAAPAAPPAVGQRPVMAAPPQPQIPTGTIPGQIGAQRPERIERGDHGERGDRGERFDRGNARPDPTPGVPRNSAVRPAPQIDHPAPRAPEAVRAAPPPVAPPAAQVQHPAPVQQPRAAEVPRPPAAPEARHPEAPPRARAEGARDDQREGRDRGRKEQ
jgi:hypothetical protein